MAMDSPANQSVVVVEAVKLLETELRTSVNSIWVVTSPHEIQAARLVNFRKISPEEAEQRINAQTTQAEKISQANVIITNNGSFEDTWKQVYDAWKKIALPTSVMLEPMVSLPKGKLAARRRDSACSYDSIVKLVNRLNPNGDTRSKTDLLRSLNDNAFMLLEVKSKLVGIAGWQVENLICRTDIFVDPAIPINESIQALIEEVEKSAKDHQCEASLVFLPPAMARQVELWHGLGYANRTPQSLEVQAWQEAALEWMPSAPLCSLKQLRQDRVLRPIEPD